MSKKHYTEEFKREVIEYSLSSAKPVKTICKEFGITTGSYYNWKKRLLSGDAASPSRGSGAASEVSREEMADEIRQLRKDLAASKRREEILKKAAIILGETPPDNMR